MNKRIRKKAAKRDQALIERVHKKVLEQFGKIEDALARKLQIKVCENGEERVD